MNRPAGTAPFRVGESLPGGEGAAFPSLSTCYGTCVALTRLRARNFYYAFLTLPGAARRAVCAIYAYCRILDDIADGPLTPPAKAAGLAEVRRELDRALAGESRDPVFRALADTVCRYGIARQHLLDIAAGVEQDLTVDRYRRFEDLYRYCYLVASSVGLACLEVFGYRSEAARAAAVDLGIAMQLTNIVRDVAEDAAKGRIYLPLEDMAAFGVGEADVRAKSAGAALRRLIAFEVERAHEYFERARALFRHLPRRSRPCPMVLFGVYRSLLGEIERAGYDVLAFRAALGRGRRARLALALYLRGLLWKAPS